MVFGGMTKEPGEFAAQKVFRPDASDPVASSLFDGRAGNRLPASYHQAFDLVDLTGFNLSEIKAWPVILDEALRLLAPGGVLRLKVSNSRFAAMFEIMRRILRWTDGAVVLLSQRQLGDVQLVELKLTTSARREASLADFDIVVVTDGAQPERIRNLVASTRAAADMCESRPNVQILISCPSSVSDHDMWDFGDDCVVIADEDDGAWITRRKNTAIARGTARNVLVVHDRYTLSPDFFVALARYGPDFDVLICGQKITNGDRFPDLVTVGSDVTTTTAGLLDPQDWGPHVYVNGGAILAKRRIFESIPWNELLRWGQFEDIEWTRRLRDTGREPRYAPDATLLTLEPRAGYLEGFDPIPFCPDVYIAPGRPDESQSSYVSPIGFNTIVPLSADGAGRLALKSGVLLSEAWAVTSAGASIAEGETGDIFFRTQEDIPVGGITIILRGRGKGGEWMAGGQRLKVWTILGLTLVKAPLSAARDRATVRLSVRARTTISFKETALIRSRILPGW